MLKRLGFFSQALVESTKFDESFAVISITNPASEAKINGASEILRLEFLDIEGSDADQEMIDEGIAFNEKHADEIIAFVNKINNMKEINTLVVHCHAGVSRSAAVSLSVFNYLNLHKMIDHTFDFPEHMQTNYSNKLVIDTFEKKLNQSIVIPTEEEAKHAREECLVYIPKMFSKLK